MYFFAGQMYPKIPDSTVYTKKMALEAVCALGSAAVAWVACALGCGLTAVAAASLLARLGPRAIPSALALSMFPSAFACLWALDAVDAARRAYGSGVIRDLGGIRHAGAGAMRVLCVLRPEHVAELPVRAARPALWRSHLRTATGRRRPACSWAAASTRWLIAAAAMCVLREVVWRASWVHRAVALLWAVTRGHVSPALAKKLAAISAGATHHQAIPSISQSAS